MNKLFIDKLVIISIKDHQVLVTLGKGQDNWQIPTTVRQDQETDIEALSRLVKEELGDELATGSVSHFGTFEVHAHSHGGNPEKTDKAEVRLKCYIGELRGPSQPSARIEKVDFFWFNQKHLLLQAYYGIFDELKEKGRLE